MLFLLSLFLCFWVRFRTDMCYGMWADQVACSLFQGWFGVMQMARWSKYLWCVWGDEEVQQGKASLFFCKCDEMCELQTRYKGLFAGLFEPLHVFRQSQPGCIPFLRAGHHVQHLILWLNAFSKQDSIRLFGCLSDSGVRFWYWLSLFH